MFYQLLVANNIYLDILHSVFDKKKNILQCILYKCRYEDDIG